MMKPARDALHDLRMIARHIRILATTEIKAEDAEEIKVTIREWARMAHDKQLDAVDTIDALIEAWERGVDISTLQDYSDIAKLAQAGD